MLSCRLCGWNRATYQELTDKCRTVAWALRRPDTDTKAKTASHDAVKAAAFFSSQASRRHEVRFAPEHYGRATSFVLWA